MASFTDDFNRADSTDLGANWVEVSGDWSISSNQLSPGSAGGTIILRAAGAMDTSDNSAQATIAATTAASHGIWCRGNSNITSGYLWRNDGTSWDLFSVVGGSFSVIGTYVAAASPGDVAKVQAVGSTIKGFVNGIERVSVTDTNVASGTSVGIRSESTSAIRFDDFTAADITAGAILGVATAAETAQPLTGSKAATLGTAAETAAAQPLTGTKSATLTPAVEQDTAQTLAGAKTGTLGIATAAEAAQPLAGLVTAALGTAATVETAQPLTGAKSATLAPAEETSTARPLATAGADDDIDVSVGAPYSRWTVSEPSSQPWPVGVPY
ncbi:hypothetical protein F7R91_14650 [Streptomyces luteolifulvus]|uniref:Uncharacterized protein n=1 Tax=Streptomyces luteolifulvus TaxID=2615112 RepID=A0A6H9UZI3_9ACTN|nr:hypothetical protein [Streptomyces luteolifulvus]KAB1146814.1 hypothetical protein F7R91_14650 [Streptomyces luteolifulvus]